MTYPLRKAYKYKIFQVMDDTIMDLFDNPRFRKHTASLMIAFGVAATGMPVKAEETDPETLWKTQTFDAVISLKPCPETGVCGYIYWLNPDDAKLFDYFGDPKRKAARGSFPDIAGPTRDDVNALCGFSPKMHFTQAADGHWQGRMEMRGMGMTVSVDATKKGERELRVVTSKGIFYQTETWVRVDKDDARYPKCKP